MKFSLIVCTYQRRNAIEKLINSVVNQTLYSSEIIIVDGSTNNDTKAFFKKYNFNNLRYFLVDSSNRGLTKQRNFGISKVSIDSEVVCFLDDDTILDSHYFEEVIKTFNNNKAITGIGGVAINENNWELMEDGKYYHPKRYKIIDGYAVKEGSRNVLRNFLVLGAKQLPHIMPSFSHGNSYSYPLNGELYKVDLLIGMSMSFRRLVIENLKFSTYFEGYGLYEDADFSLRALNYGLNVINTNAKLEHHHDVSGRPNKYQYGKMVVRNGWYVWRVKYPNPSIKARFKWNAIVLLLIFVRFTNVLTTNKRKEAFTEALGRLVGWFLLFLKKPKQQ